MATPNDIMILNNKLEELGLDICEKQKTIVKKAAKGKNIIYMLKVGIDMNLKEKDYNEIIMNLLHFKHYNYLVQHIFLEWDSIETSELYSEQIYLKMANHSKKTFTDFDEELFTDTLTDLLFYKANGNENKIEKLFTIYEDLVSKEWLDAQFIKSTKRG